eukprot:c27721_g1_i1 orf=168-1124(+)
MAATNCALLNNGARIPLIGFGTLSSSASPEDAKASISAAIEVGYRHFDTASVYKNSEIPLGQALADAFKAGLLIREDVFVTSKLWCSDNHPEDVIPAIRKSLSALQLDYLDLYLIHFPLRTKKGVRFPPKEDDFLPVDINATWQVMENCVELGLTKAIGVSNFSSKKLHELINSAKITPAVNQVEMHPRWQQRKLLEYCNKANIHVSAWSPLGAPSTAWGTLMVLEHPVIKEIAIKHGRTPAQVVLRWGVEQGVSVLPKSYNRKRMLENFQIFDWQLTEMDHEEIRKIEQKKMFAGEFLCNATTSPYKTIHDIWDGEI